MTICLGPQITVGDVKKEHKNPETKNLTFHGNAHIVVNIPSWTVLHKLPLGASSYFNEEWGLFMSFWSRQVILLEDGETIAKCPMECWWPQCITCNGFLYPTADEHRQSKRQTNYFYTRTARLWQEDKRHGIRLYAVGGGWPFPYFEVWEGRCTRTECGKHSVRGGAVREVR